MESKARKWLGIIISIIVIVVFAYNRYRRYEAKQERNRVQQQQIENAKAVQEATKKIDEDAKNKLSEQLKDAAKKAGNIAKGIEKLKNAEMNKEIEDGYNIVKLDGKYLIVKDSDVDQAVELAGVTDAHVIPTNDQDRNQNYNVLVVKKDGEWRVVDETKKGEDVLVALLVGPNALRAEDEHVVLGPRRLVGHADDARALPHEAEVVQGPAGAGAARGHGPHHSRRRR